MYTKLLAQGTKFGSGTTGLDNPGVYGNGSESTTVLFKFYINYFFRVKVGS